MKSLIRILCFTVSLTILFSRPVDVQKARSAALGQYPGKTIEKCEVLYDNLYLSTFNEGGFVLSSSDDGFPAILAYSDRSPAGHNPAFDDMCKNFNRQIGSFKSDDRPVHADWRTLSNGSLQKESISASVQPLISSRWNQSPYYNSKFPYFTLSGHTNQQPYVGCVAVVMGQLLNYYEHPLRGFGKRWYYSDTTDSLLTAWYDTTWYHYDNMPDSLTDRSGVPTADQSEIEAVAQLLYHCAVSVDMEFDPEGSSSAYEDMMYALTSYFDYNTEMIQEVKSDYSDTDWRQKIITELTAGRPLPYRGSSEDGGHAFLLDGYQTTTSTYFHFNWGWGGYYDGWFLLSALDPAEGYDFTDNQAAVFGISPNSDDLTRYAYTGFEGYQAGWIYSGSNFYSLTGEEDLVYGFSQNGQWLISPRIHVPNNNNVTFKVYAQQINSGTKECKVTISSTDTLRSSFTTELGRIVPGAGWSEHSFSLRPYKNTDIHIGIQYLSTSGYIILDDLSIWTPKVIIGIDEILPQSPDLLNAYPNPFNPNTTIVYHLDHNSNVKLNIYDIKGNHVSTLTNAYHESGDHSVLWDASALSSGIYICSLIIDNQLAETQKMLLVK